MYSNLEKAGMNEDEIKATIEDIRTELLDTDYIDENNIDYIMEAMGLYDKD